ncbi:hypothetical protein NE237_007592 [Protea cynaroides]|uniref:Wall-associated receptor kinase galacturonan-binding domain-containing protein n=1 Tax=Protea cynaroides TaxID=273540 RepID=A0A9Q0KPE9_9MAGN|nr:hypothetical protein NE237_007592 [Protea cynaroides]
MGPLLVLVLVLLLVLLLIQLSTAATTASPMVKTGCSEKCGNISVPYPFGMGDENCYRDGSFKVICNSTSYDPPKLFTGDVEILDISLQGQERQLGYVSRDCYSSPGTWSFRVQAYYSNGSPFTLSETENRFTVLGIGCCQTSIPKGFSSFTLNVTSYENHELVYEFNPCSVAFIVDYNWYNFSTSDLLNFTYNIDGTGSPRVPFVLDWAIAWPSENNKSCEAAQTDMNTYACGSNSVCSESKNGVGYSCNCSHGYQGNPYLENGCQEVECLLRVEPSDLYSGNNTDYDSLRNQVIGSLDIDVR